MPSWRSLTILISMLIPVAALGATITFDRSHTTFATTGGYSQFETLLSGNGHTVQTHTGTVTAAALSGTDVFVISTYSSTTPYSASEISDIQAFVAAGGGLLLTSDVSGHSAQAIPIAAAFGISLSADTSTGPLVISPSAISAGVSSLSLDGGAREVQSLSPGFVPVLSGGSAFGAILSGDPSTGLGKVAYFGDVNIFANFNGGFDPPMSSPSVDNPALALNTANWLATPVPEPSTALLLALGLVGLGTRGRRSSG